MLFGSKTIIVVEVIKDDVSYSVVHLIADMEKRRR
jgi:hypothetical protein